MADTNLRPSRRQPQRLSALRSRVSRPLMTTTEALRRIHLLELLQEEVDAEASGVAPLPDDAAETWCAGQDRNEPR